MNSTNATLKSPPGDTYVHDGLAGIDFSPLMKLRLNSDGEGRGPPPMPGHDDNPERVTDIA